MTLIKKIGEVQKEIGKISKDKDNPFFKSKYFDINQLLEQLNPILEKKGLILTQPLDYNEENDRTLLITQITDGDEKIEFKTPLPQNPDPQKMGSVITYYRRYTLQSFFCLQAEDDDGNAGASNVGKKKKTANDLPI